MMEIADTEIHKTKFSQQEKKYFKAVTKHGCLTQTIKDKQEQVNN